MIHCNPFHYRFSFIHGLPFRLRRWQDASKSKGCWTRWSLLRVKTMRTFNVLVLCFAKVHLKLLWRFSNLGVLYSLWNVNLSLTYTVPDWFIWSDFFFSCVKCYFLNEVLFTFWSSILAISAMCLEFISTIYPLIYAYNPFNHQPNLKTHLRTVWK